MLTIKILCTYKSLDGRKLDSPFHVAQSQIANCYIILPLGLFKFFTLRGNLKRNWKYVAKLFGEACQSIFFHLRLYLRLVRRLKTSFAAWNTYGESRKRYKKKYFGRRRIHHSTSLNNSIFARNQGEITQSNHDQPLRNPRVSKIILN